MSANTSDSNFSTAQENSQRLFSAYQRMNLFLERKREEKKEKKKKHTKNPWLQGYMGFPGKFAWVNTLESLHAPQSNAEQKANRGDLILSPE